MKIKTIFLLLITLLPSVCLCGCWDYKEYENLAMVSAVGFDTDGTSRQLTVTVEYLVPGGGSSQATGGGGKGSTGSAVIKATGSSVDDALTKVQQAADKKLFFGYMQEIIIGESAAGQITNDIIGYIIRTPNIRNSAYLAVAQGKAEDILATAVPNTTEPTGKYIHNLIDQTLNSGSAYPVTIQDFAEALAIGGEEPVAPMITAVENKASSSDGSSAADSSESSSGTASGAFFEDQGNSIDEGAVVLGSFKKGYYQIDGIAAFNKDKLAGRLDGNECLGLGWMTNQALNPYEIVKTSSDQNVASTLIFRVTNSKCKIKIQIVNGKPVVSADAYVEADLRKFSNNISADFLTPDIVSMMEKGLADNVRGDIIKAIEKGQKQLKTDIFQIGFTFYRQYPQLWHSRYEKNWEEIFPTLQINVKVTAKVIDTGTSIKKFEGK